MKPSKEDLEWFLQAIRDLHDATYDHDEREDEYEAEWQAWCREDDEARAKTEERYDAACDRDLRSLTYASDE